MQNFEEEYLDVLQNIEVALASVYREETEMTDYVAMNAIDKLIRAYKLEATGRPAQEPTLNALGQLAYDRMRNVCEWRLGRTTLTDKRGKPFSAAAPLTLEEILACLKCIRRSIEKWNKEGGRRGYFEFVKQFLP